MLAQTMKSNVGRWGFAAMLVAIIVVFVFSGYFSKTMNGRGVAGFQVVGEINGETIKAEDLGRMIQAQRRQYAELLEKNPEFAKFLFNEQMLSGMVENLIQNRARIQFSQKRLGLFVADGAIRRAVAENAVFQTNGQFDREKYKQLLAANGLTPGKFEEQVRDDVSGELVREFFELTAATSQDELARTRKIRTSKRDIKYVLLTREGLKEKISVSPGEVAEFKAKNADAVKKYFDAHITEFQPEPEVKARHILLKDKTPENRKKLEALRGKLTTKNFEQNAKDVSEEPGAKERGGDLGWFGRGVMDPVFEKAAFDMKPGAISSIVESSFGYHLIYVSDRKEPKKKTFEESQDTIAEKLVREQKDPKSVMDALTPKVIAALSTAKVGSKVEGFQVQEGKGLSREKAEIPGVGNWEHSFNLTPGKVEALDVRGDKIVAILEKDYQDDKAAVTDAELVERRAGALFAGYMDAFLQNSRKSVDKSVLGSLARGFAQ